MVNEQIRTCERLNSVQLEDRSRTRRQQLSHRASDRTSRLTPARWLYEFVSRRPGLDVLMQDDRAGKFDCVLVWSLDRFRRNLLHCLSCIEELQEFGIPLYCGHPGACLDRRTPASKFLLHVFAAAVKFERSLILERAASE